MYRVSLDNKEDIFNCSERDINFKAIICREQAKLFQLEIVIKQYCGGGVLSVQLKGFRFILYR